MKKDILGVLVDDITEAEALAIVKERIDSGEQGYIVTPNAEMIIDAQTNPSFRENLNGGFLALPDSFYLFQASKVLNKELTKRITGIDFTYELCALAAEHGYGVFLLGGKEGVAEQASKRLHGLYTSLKVVGAYSGGVLEKNNEQILERLHKESIDILFVAFGHEKQEKWMAENLDKLNVKVAIGIGGSLDYISGRVQRAPKWMQSAGLEWFYRLLKDPKRIKRQIKLPLFPLLVLKEKFSKQ
jgi:N-acetylglucosaminyldiphosphoundecaprenol N-acetyl-beta-D-mannosaminyltransferase